MWEYEKEIFTALSWYFDEGLDLDPQKNAM